MNTRLSVFRCLWAYVVGWTVIPPGWHMATETVAQARRGEIIVFARLAGAREDPRYPAKGDPISHGRLRLSAASSPSRLV